MKIKYQNVDEQYAQAYFTFSKDEINEIYLKSADIYKVIEDIIKDTLLNNFDNILPFFKFQYLRKIEKDQPLLVIAKFGLFPSLSIDLSEFKYQNIDKEYPESKIIEKLNQLFNKKTEWINTDIIDYNCKVNYDINYLRDNILVNSLKDREIIISYDLNEAKLFVGKRIDEELIFDNNQDFITKGIIKEIYKPAFKEEEITLEDINFLDLFNLKNLEEIKEKISYLESKRISIINYANEIIDYIYNNKKINVSKYLLDLTSKDIIEETTSKSLEKSFIEIFLVNQSKSILIKHKKFINQYQEYQKKLNNTNKNSNYDIMEELKSNLKIIEYFENLGMCKIKL